jgi:hypothetical protein
MDGIVTWQRNHDPTKRSEIDSKSAEWRFLELKTGQILTCRLYALRRLLGRVAFVPPEHYLYGGAEVAHI